MLSFFLSQRLVKWTMCCSRQPQPSWRLWLESGSFWRRTALSPSEHSSSPTSYRDQSKCVNEHESVTTYDCTSGWLLKPISGIAYIQLDSVKAYCSVTELCKSLSASLQSAEVRSRADPVSSSGNSEERVSRQIHQL